MVIMYKAVILSVSMIHIYQVTKLRLRTRTSNSILNSFARIFNFRIIDHCLGRCLFLKVQLEFVT